MFTIKCNGQIMKSVDVEQYGVYTVNKDKFHYQWSERKLAEDWIKWLEIWDKANNANPNIYELVELENNKKEE